MSTSPVRRRPLLVLSSATDVLPRAALPAARPFAIWLGLMGYVVVAKVLLDTFLPNAFALPGQAFSWQGIIISAAAGAAGIAFARATGFSPDWARG
jgi:hypothetical protein